jgi:hypothetical protein
MKNYILKDENAVYYECGFSCDNEIYLRLGEESIFITDGRYSVEAAEKLKHTQIVKARDVVAEAAKLLQKYRIKKLHFDPNDFTVAEYDKLKNSKYTHFEAAPDFSKRDGSSKRPKRSNCSKRRHGWERRRSHSSPPISGVMASIRTKNVSFSSVPRDSAISANTLSVSNRSSPSMKMPPNRMRCLRIRNLKSVP